MHYHIAEVQDGGYIRHLDGVYPTKAEAQSDAAGWHKQEYQYSDFDGVVTFECDYQDCE